MRTPVNSLLSFSELLKAGAISEEKMGLYLDQISHTLNQTSATMNNLLNWSATQMQGFNPNIIAVDMALVAEEILEHFVDRAKAKKISIQNDIEIGCLVMADKNMAELVLRNLLSNAIKYSREYDSISITSKDAGEKIYVLVSDEGVGMEEDKIQFFNKPDKKPLKSTMGTAREKGTGLGLLLCKTFASLMKGTLQVARNKNNKGLVFELGLLKVNTKS
jgi:signal transduction histidine kinase